MNFAKARNMLGLVGALLAVAVVAFDDDAPRGLVEVSFPAAVTVDTATANSRVLAERAHRDSAEIASRAIVDSVELELDMRLGGPTSELLVASR